MAKTLGPHRDCRVVVQVTAEEKDNWMNMIDDTIYDNLSEMIRGLMNDSVIALAEAKERYGAKDEENEQSYMYL